MVGKTISHYKILEKIGSGGMGIVYKAQDLKLDRFVALKFLPPHLTTSEEEKQRFIHEAKAASTLEHNNICNIHEIDETKDGQLFISMAYYEGETLDKRIKEKPLPIEEAIDIAIQIAQGLAKAHEKEITHRDIKPANIMLTKEGVVKVLDFGLAKLSTQTKLTKESTTLGTVSYMSPEQAKGEDADYRTDIWSLGVIIYEILTGQLPFKGEYESAVIYSILNDTQEPVTGLRTGVSMELELVVNKCLEKNPKERYQHVDELLVDLKRLKRNSESLVISKPASASVKKISSKTLKWTIVLIALILIIQLVYFVLKPLLFETEFIGEPRPIVVIGFKNQTGEETYDYLQEVIPNLLITSLEQSQYLQVITWERLHDLLKQLGIEGANLFDRDVGFELCQMEGVDAIVLGSFTKAGDIFVTDLKVLDVASKSLLASASAKGEGVGSILQNQIDDLSEKITAVVGLPEETVRGSQLKISEVTTASMDAYNHFLRGRNEFERFYFDDARQSLVKALEFDSTFAIAHLYLALVFDNLGDLKSKIKAYEKAKSLSEKSTEKDKLYIEQLYAGNIEGNQEKRLKILKQMVKKYPKEKEVHYSLANLYQDENFFKEAIEEYNKVLELDPSYGSAMNDLGYIYADLEQFEKAIECFRKYATISPDDANPFDSMAEMYFRMGMLDEAVAKYKEALAVKPDFGSDWRIAYIYAIKEDYAESMKWLDQYIIASTSRRNRYDGVAWKGFYRYMQGKINQSLEELSRISDQAIATGDVYERWVTDYIKAWIYHDKGEYEIGQKILKNLGELVKEYYPSNLPLSKVQYKYYLGMAELRAGQIDSAKFRLFEIKSLLPELDTYRKDESIFRYNLFYADLLLVQDSLKKAIVTAEKTLRLDKVPSMSTWRIFGYNLPFIKDVLARAYYKNGELDKAIAEYERLTNFDPNSNNRRLIHPKYRYRLAKLYEEKSWSDKAIEQYEKFLEIWKDADEDLEELIDARKQLIKLNEMANK